MPLESSRFSEQFSVTFEPEMLTAMLRYCHEKDMTRTELVRIAVNEKLKLGYTEKQLMAPRAKKAEKVS